MKSPLLVLRFCRTFRPPAYSFANQVGDAAIAYQIDQLGYRIAHSDKPSSRKAWSVFWSWLGFGDPVNLLLVGCIAAVSGILCWIHLI